MTSIHKVLLAALTVVCVAGNAFAQAAASPTAPEKEKPSWLLSTLQIRDSLDARSQRGASLTINRQRGNTSYSLKGAARLPFGDRFLPRKLEMWGWGFSAGAQIAKDSSPTKPVDGRAFVFGGNGTIDFGIPLVSSIDLQSVADRVGDTRDVGLRYIGTAVLSFLQHGIPYNPRGYAYFIYPVVGLHVDRHREATKNGRLAGGNAGVIASYYPGGFLWRFHAFGNATRAKDFVESADASKRASTYWDAGIEYAFVDPLSTKPRALVPTLSLKRTVGSNFLTGEADTAKTVLTLSLKLN